MKPLSALAALTLAVVFAVAPALAAAFVQDGAGMFSQAAVTRLDQELSSFHSQTGKSIVVITVPSLPSGQDISTAAQNAFAQQQINGTLIYIARDDHKAYVLPDRAAVQAGWFTSSTSTSIVQSMAAEFKQGNYDAGITSAVNDVLNIYRSHLHSLRRTGSEAAPSYSTRSASSGGVHISMFWWIIIAIIAFLVIRSIIRAASGPRYYGGGPVPPGASGYGPGVGPGYGPGPGYGGYGGGFGGGGGFWSGLLGGLGGAFLGNELFRGTQGGAPFGGADVGSGADQQQVADSGGWQNDPGQADPGAGGSTDWGGGGFGDLGGGGGGGDFGGGGGGDFGGGGDGGGGGSW
jgi:uncharacterized membrane protein YgcG